MATWISLINTTNVIAVAAIAFLFMIVVAVIDVAKNTEKMGD